MDNKPKNWTYEEFHAFTMLYAANADGHITIEEELLIRPELPEEAYSRIKTLFLSMHDAEALDLIMSYCDKFCKSQADKDKIVDDMRAIFKADASFDPIERGVLQIFERIV
jgi:hypothetical protein